MTYNWHTISNYSKRFNLSRTTIYDRISKGELKTETRDGVKFILEPIKESPQLDQSSTMEQAIPKLTQYDLAYYFDTRSTQKKAIKTALENGLVITDLDAYKLGVRRLGAIICELRKEGLQIKTTLVPPKNYAEYFIPNEPEF